MRMPSFRKTVQILQPAILPIVSALGRGLDAANEQHAGQQFRRRDDPWYYAHTVRRVACDQLRSHGLQAVAEESDRPYLALSGLLVFHRNVALRIMRPEQTKAGRFVTPIPGRSAPRQRFWRQDSMLPGMQTDNLLLLWQDRDGELIEPMQLVRPVGGDHRRSSLRVAMGWSPLKRHGEPSCC